jgi:NAD+ kinase
MRLKGAVAVVGHFERPKVKKIAAKAAKLLHNWGVACAAADIKKEKFNSKGTALVVVVGGDGTMLRVARELKGSVPVVGIAAGERSVLMAIKPEKMEPDLEKIALGKFKIQKRMRLRAFADGKKLPPALNEVMLVNRNSGGIVDYRLHVNGKKVYRKKADGCIVATPTGSTGHAYSAGGKRLPAGSSKIAVVPMNPLYREAKPKYCSGGSTIVLDGFDTRHWHEAVIDGQPRFAVRKRLVVQRGADAFFVKT